MEINDVFGIGKAATGDVGAPIAADEAFVLRRPEMAGEVQGPMTFDALEIVNDAAGTGEFRAELVAGALFQIDHHRSHDTARAIVGITRDCGVESFSRRGGRGGRRGRGG